MLFITEVIAHFHPVLVHLPIGILLLAILFHWLSSKEKLAGLSIAIPIAYLAGAITAILSCITGYLLSGLHYLQGVCNFPHKFHLYLIIIIIIICKRIRQG